MERAGDGEDDPLADRYGGWLAFTALTGAVAAVYVVFAGAVGLGLLF